MCGEATKNRRERRKFAADTMKKEEEEDIQWAPADSEPLSKLTFLLFSFFICIFSFKFIF